MIKCWNVDHVKEFHDIFELPMNIANGEPLTGWVSNSTGTIGGWVINDDDNTYEKFKRKERKKKIRRLNAIFILSKLVDNIKSNR